MEHNNYTVERNAQIVLALLRAKGIKRVIASPGTTNIAIVGSMMHDNFFEMYSAPDERSAAYMACGLAAETGEPVVLTCTGATASRNYLPGLTEAFYRKLPVIALTSTLNIDRSGHLQAQFIDRTEQPKDTVKISVQIPSINTDEDVWGCVIKVNNALLELTRHGGGPVHINLTTRCELYDFSVKELPVVRDIRRFESLYTVPSLPKGKICVFIGSHKPFTQEETEAIERFCESNNSVVFGDLTSGYYGKYKVNYAIVASQHISDDNMAPDVLIHIGEVSGEYYTLGKIKPKEVWRVSPDGELRDLFKKLNYIFEMDELSFFTHYVSEETSQMSYYNDCKFRVNEIRSLVPELPFSNMWVASQMTKYLPRHSAVHLGILNTLRSWNFADFPEGVSSFCNVGGFGIDGGVSTVIGASLADPDKQFFCFIGDLAFFYDMNSLGNRHVGKNLHIMLVNNGKGTEFRNYTHPGSKFGADADLYIAAGGHYGNKSNQLVRHYAEDLNFSYLSAANKEEFMNAIPSFVSCGDKSVIFELFISDEQENAALKSIIECHYDSSIDYKNAIKRTVKSLLGESIIETVKKVIK